MNNLHLFFFFQVFADLCNKHYPLVISNPMRNAFHCMHEVTMLLLALCGSYSSVPSSVMSAFSYI